MDQGWCDQIIPGPTGPLVVRCYGTAQGVAAPLVCIHPVNTGAGVWSRLASAMSTLRPVFAPDLRGHGASTPHGPYGVADYAADILAVLDVLEIERAHLVGGSIGGPVAVWLAARHPDRILSITSFGGALHLNLPEEAFTTLASSLAQDGGAVLLRRLIRGAIAEEKRSPALVEEAVGIALGGGRADETILRIIRDAFSTDVTADARRCRAPSLIVNGDEDTTCTPAHGLTMATALGGRAKRLESIGHLPMIEAPETAVALLADHLARCESGHG
jgi:pimeloyl-ACP methyl ester carboxylesterase